MNLPVQLVYYRYKVLYEVECACLKDALDRATSDWGSGKEPKAEEKEFNVKNIREAIDDTECIADSPPWLRGTIRKCCDEIDRLEAENDKEKLRNEHTGGLNKVLVNNAQSQLNEVNRLEDENRQWQETVKAVQKHRDNWKKEVEKVIREYKEKL